ncbi:MAG: hypothetical protein RLZZ97_1652, partial [Gemmatimonadota bacterium]
HEAAHDRFIGTVSFTGASERAVQFDVCLFRRAADETAREQTQPTGTCCV